MRKPPSLHKRYADGGMPTAHLPKLVLPGRDHAPRTNQFSIAVYI